MLDKKFFEFKDEVQTKQANLTAEYQITRLASDKYQWYDFSVNNAKLLNAKDTLKSIANLRGGKGLNANLTKHVMAMPIMGSLTVTASALQLAKTASAERTEPWKVIALNGVEYFVNAIEGEEEKIGKTASVATKHVYTVSIKAHNVREIAKIAEIAEGKLGALPATTQIPTQESIAFDVASAADLSTVESTIRKEIEGDGIYLPDSNIGVYNDSCPCGCGKHQHDAYKQLPETPQTVPQPQPQLFMLVPVNTPANQPIMASYASTVETLKKYADAHYKDYKIYDDKNNVVASAELNQNSKTFAEELTAFLDEQIALSKQADDKPTVVKQDGTIAQDGEPVNPGDTVIKPNGDILRTQEELASLSVQADVDDLEHQRQNIDPNEKSSDETKAKGDDNVKRWKGMREDTQTGKFVVYITETEEHVFDTADAAISFMVRN